MWAGGSFYGHAQPEGLALEARSSVSSSVGTGEGSDGTGRPGVRFTAAAGGGTPGTPGALSVDVDGSDGSGAALLSATSANAALSPAERAAVAAFAGQPVGSEFKKTFSRHDSARSWVSSYRERKKQQTREAGKALARRSRNKIA
eukprot:COSAG04_NODE_14707_length_558_cov_0.899782_1_plen_144_part_10